jgi:hypothetical protein
MEFHNIIRDALTRILFEDLHTVIKRNYRQNSGLLYTTIIRNFEQPLNTQIMLTYQLIKQRFVLDD